MNRFLRDRCLVLVIGAAFSPLAFSQSQAPCDLREGQTDVNEDGYADQLVSPDARLFNADLDCSDHTIEAGAVIRNSGAAINVTIRSGARVIDSLISWEAEVQAGAKVVGSGVDGEGTRIGPNAVVRAGSFVSDGTQMAANSRVSSSDVAGSEIGEGSVVRGGSRLTFVKLEENVRVNGADISANGSSDPTSTLIRSGTRVAQGASILGDIDLGPNSYIGPRAQLVGGTKFVGGDFRLGADSFVDFGGDILGNVKIGKRVSIGSLPDIGGNVRIGDDTKILSVFFADHDVTVGQRCNIDGPVTLGERTTVRNDVTIGFNVVAGTDVVIRANSVIGNRVTIGNGAIIRRGSIVPDDFVISADTIYPNDYQNSEQL